jgi:hypothetical protein
MNINCDEKHAIDVSTNFLIVSRSKIDLASKISILANLVRGSFSDSDSVVDLFSGILCFSDTVLWLLWYLETDFLGLKSCWEEGTLDDCWADLFSAWSPFSYLFILQVCSNDTFIFIQLIQQCLIYNIIITITRKIFFQLFILQV